ncbi:hypothetical protein EMIHUDRAFT_259475 [Emiliania huxleyi CCMP1516]|uniref:Uncharacterized protein n=2 Tax=Emiliania huxleyi TaxID=2903 RepID=A0A0D3I0I9_EMIH1|nr:hypothetical protein EMIHUDRAFT_259475 [Emiliania huxleyi CCMP1516]EOD04774.1 hypothetical protein EMIHUDRAFT_259475 [Emiliania huxleyi CCMP1516]|eukprot:XP_005757203.1 hypothetical protein EMIHUDRAFT_259475 [Emiliania huxleyi CCMP1516]
MMVRANMMGLPADYCSSDAAADKEECSACATVDRTDLRLALRSVWSLGTRGGVVVSANASTGRFGVRARQLGASGRGGGSAEPSAPPPEPSAPPPEPSAPPPEPSAPEPEPSEAPPTGGAVKTPFTP